MVTVPLSQVAFEVGALHVGLGVLSVARQRHDVVEAGAFWMRVAQALVDVSVTYPASPAVAYEDGLRLDGFITCCAALACFSFPNAGCASWVLHAALVLGAVLASCAAVSANDESSTHRAIPLRHWPTVRLGEVSAFAFC